MLTLTLGYALLRRWWHCLWGCLDGHCMVDARHCDGSRSFWCTCGRLFWKEGD